MRLPARDRFVLPSATYLAGSSLGLQPRTARVAIDAVLDAWGSDGVEAWVGAGWLEHAESLAPSLARLVGTAAQEVIVMNSLTVNLHLVLAALYRPTASRFRIAIDADAFPSDAHAVASVVALHGHRPEVAVAGSLDDLDESVAVVVAAGVSYLTGERADIAAITARAHAVGALAVWDLAHAIGNVPIDLAAAAADAAVWCSYKYLNGGPGAPGGAFIAERHHGAPRLAGWWGVDLRERFRMETAFVAGRGAAGFALSTPSILALAPLVASLELFDLVGIEVLRERSIALTGHLQRRLASVGRARLLTPTEPERRGCQLSIALPDAGEVAARLRIDHDVVCDFREPDVLRLAPTPFYNSEADCDRAADALAALLA